jgi:hypothetical protein
VLANAAVMVTLSGLDERYQLTEVQLEEKRANAMAKANAALAAAELVSFFLCLSVSLPVRLSVCLPVCMSARLRVCVSACLSVSHSACLSACLSGCLSDCVCITVRISLSLLGGLGSTHRKGATSRVKASRCLVR